MKREKLVLECVIFSLEVQQKLVVELWPDPFEELVDCHRLELKAK